MTPREKRLLAGATPHEEELISKALNAPVTAGKLIIHLDVPSALSLIGSIQLAMRHPNYFDDSVAGATQICCCIAEAIQDWLDSEAPDFGKIAKEGWVGCVGEFGARMRGER